MWKVWHGNLYGASIALGCFYGGVDIHVMIAEADSARSTLIETGSRASGRIVVVPGLLNMTSQNRIGCVLKAISANCSESSM